MASPGKPTQLQSSCDVNSQAGGGLARFGRAILRAWAYLALAVLFLLAACMPNLAKVLSQSNTNTIQTSSAQTVIAQFTLSAGPTAVAVLTQAAIPPSPTPSPSEPPVQPSETPPPPPTDTPLPTFTPLPPTNPPVSTFCDQAELIGDVTVPPNSSFSAGAQFVKTWRVRNAGSCTWNSRYALVFSGGDPMGGVTTFSVPAPVSPGQIVDVSATLTAPSASGYYQSSWMLRNATQHTFGAGQNASQPLVVQIQVVQPIVWNNYSYDFAANYCSAKWQSGTGGLSCPGLNGDTNGATFVLTTPYLESGRANSYALITQPNRVANGWISGYYPYFMINTGDHFISEVGCLRDNPGCDLTFQLDYRTTSGAIRNLGGWREVYDGRTTPVDIDLSDLAGQRLQFILTVTNNGDSRSASGFWLTPSIQNLAPSQTAVLSWTRSGGRAEKCDELRVYLTSRRIGEAYAYSCRQGVHELGRISLNRDEIDQLYAWVDALSDFDGEVYRASADQPLISSISIHGKGDSDATDSEIQQINDFAAALFDAIVR